MSQYLGCLVLVLVGVACGGTTDTGSESGGGNSQGGAGHAGSAGNSSAGKATGGSVGTGGSPTVDPRCPATHPRGVCTDQDPELSCEYDQFTGCLCYTNPNTYAFCQQVDDNCPNIGGAAGTGGSVGASGAAGMAGLGGISAKIVAPPQPLVCTCTTATWSCVLSF
jgi:hypothetical protein